MLTNINKKYIIISYIIPFNILWDFFSVFYTQKADILAIIRAMVMLIILLYYLPGIVNNNINNKATHSILTFIIYVIVLLPFSNDILYSVNISLKVIISMLMYPLGYAMVSDKDKMIQMINKIPIIYIIITAGFILSNYFDLGGYDYSSQINFQSGGYTDSWNNLTYSILLAPLYYCFSKDTKYKKRFSTIFLVFVIILLIISFKRIALIGLLFGYFIFFMFYREISKTIMIIISIILILTITFPIYDDIVYNQYNARSDRFEEGWILSEARYLETPYVWKEVFSFKNPIKSIFGLRPFDSIGNYASGIFGRRQLHIDYNLIINTTGIIGLILYINIYKKILKKYKIIYYNKKHKNINILTGVFASLLFTSLITSFGGQMYHITFRIIIFFYMGALTRILTDNLKIKNNNI